MQIANYLIRETLHQGNPYTIYRGIEKESKIPYILKVLHKVHRDTHNTDRIENEYRLLELVDSAHVIKAHQYLQHDNDVLLVLEDIGGKSLKDFLRPEAPYSTGDFVPIALAITRGLLAIHRQHIIHKDINPANIILNRETGRLQIIDCNIATQYDLRVSPTLNPEGIDGTLSYISPEQTGRMNRAVDLRSDLYSLGVTFYEMLTGQLPFQSKDPLEIVHAHLAHHPEPPHSNCHAVPEILSELILKLIAKNPDERYQSVEGLLREHEKIRSMEKDILQSPRTFKLGEDDYSGQLHITGRLYGRQKDIRQLLSIYRKTAQDSKELVFLAGYSGTGKTALVNEIHQPITIDRGYFVQGKFDQLQRDIPYYAFTQAITQFCDMLLGESQEQLEGWKKKLLEAVGSMGKVLTDIIPNLEQIIGFQPGVPQIGSTEAKNRFNYVFQRFMQAICSSRHPLVMFIDDLQWADHGSLELLSLIMKDAGLQHLLLIGAYRTNEVSSSHPLTVLSDELRKQNVNLTTIPVENLGKKDIRDWLQDILRGVQQPDTQQLEDLSNLIFEKTRGNAFFTVQFLETIYKEEQLSFDSGGSKWNWDISEIDRMNITDNVVDLLLQRIQGLPIDVQEILKLTSCAGNHFDLETLSVIADTNTTVQTSLDIALREKLIFPLGGSHYKFGHDRIRQAAYAMVPEHQKQPVHLKIGKRLLKEYRVFDEDRCLKLTKKNEPLLFDIVKHFDIAAPLVQENEKAGILMLTLAAARKAKTAAAYQQGWRYVQQAMNFSPQQGWKENYPLMLEMYNEAVQLSYLSSQYGEMEELGRIVLQHAADPLDKSIVYEYRIMGMIAQNEFLKSVNTALELLEQLGVSIPPKPGKAQTDILLHTKEILEEKISRGLENLSPMEDKTKQLAVRLYLRSATAAVFAAQDLYPVMVNKILQLSLQYGTTPETPYLLAEYGLLNVFMGNIADAYKYNRIALELLEKLDGYESMKVRIHILGLVYTQHWRVPYKELEVKYWDLHQQAITVGDLEFAAYGLYNVALLQPQTADDLSIAARKGEEVLDIMQRMKQPFTTVVAAIALETIENLRGMRPDPTVLNIDLDAFSPVRTPDTDRLKQFYVTLFTALLNCLFEKHQVLQCTDTIEQSSILKGIAQYPIYLFYTTLLKLQVIKTGNKEGKETLMDEVLQTVDKIKEWAQFGPKNFLHRYLLLEAELYHIEGNHFQAGESYDKAITAAGENQLLCEEALINQLAAKFYLHNNREQLAGFYFQKAYRLYYKWGAIAKVKHLEENYPKYVSPGIPWSKFGTGTISSTATDPAAELLDVKSIIKASQTLSGEMQLQNLLEKLMSILIENAGAQKGLFIENADERLLIQAESTKDSVSGILDALPVEKSEKLPLSVINYVARSEKKLVFDNVSKDPNYSSDPYIQKHQPKSVVCFPIIRKEKLSAIIYLENNLVEGAFTPERMNVLNTLSSQIAISMENARVYRELDELNKSLEQKVAERTRELEEMDKAKSRFFANISHEFRTPLTLIMGPLEQILSDNPQEEMKAKARMMLRNSRRLLNLINQLLELSRLESGKMKLQASGQNIVPFVKNIVMCFESLAAQKKVGLFFHKKEENISIYFDPEKLEKIITNLLSNAFNYTPGGGKITVSVRKPADADGFPSGCVEISVRDTGIGIPGNQLPHIFDRFYRVEGMHEYKGKGAGIGLALTKELVELHNGEIDVQSSCREDYDRGTEFFIRLPMGDRHLEPEEIAEIVAPEDRLPVSKKPSPAYIYTAEEVEEEEVPDEGTELETAGPRTKKEEKSLILVVDDNPEVRIYIKGTLEPHFKVFEAADGKEGILRAKEILPDIIVSDVMMPETDGYELCRTLKKDVLTSHIPIILLTAKVSDESVLEGLETGADDYITKPFSPTLLSVRVRNLIELRRQLHMERKNRMTLLPEELPVSPLDDEFYKKLQDTIETSLSDPDFNVEALSRKLQMSQATLYRKIHALTGQAPTLFIRSYRLKRAAQLLEANAGSVSHVADRVGFPDKSYFARCFKEQFHCLPSDIQSAGTEVNVVDINNKKFFGGSRGAVFQKSPPGRRRQEIILVVEDNDDARHYIRDSLESDYRIVEASDGSEGLARAMEIIPDLIISDIMMPGMDGYELCRLLKQDVHSCHIPVVLLTAKAGEESRIKGLELGADDYITKPINAKIVLARIKNLVQLRSHLQEKRNREMTLLPVKISEPEIDREFEKELNAAIEKNLGDPEFNVEQLAKKLYMSSATLFRKIQALSGDVPSEYIRSFRMRRAAELLKRNFGSITEVAFEVGFNSRTYFTKCFKEKFHQLPSVYMTAQSES